ncbi:MAG: HAD-IB family hydrolase [Deltaproteobacteria bacterium]|nr:HAD-IB family hydrolase [Deltaproteobacteria bacterium]
MALALFDLDGTLIRANSGHSWVWREYLSGRISAAQLLEAVWWFGRYALGSADLEAAFLKIGQSVAGEREAAVRERTRLWFDEVVRGQLREGARQAIARHRQAGDTLVIATSSTVFVAEFAAASWGFDAALGTGFEAVDGTLTGRLSDPAFGRHKRDQVTRWAAAGQHRLEDASFYSDSASDLPLLEAVGHPVVVDPDRVLLRVARERGWKIVEW